MLFAFGLCALVFTVFPQLDLQISALFYGEHTKAFIYKDHIVATQAHYWVPRIAYLLGVICIGLLLLAFFKPANRFAKHKQSALFVLIFSLAGPGFLVNVVLKEHVDRARPKDISEFGGDKQFTRAFVVTNQCDTNCSFVSGHAAAAFIPIVFFWVTRRRRWLLFGIASGLLMGTVRIVQGGHFASDVVFAFFVTYAVGYWLNQVIYPSENKVLLERSVG